MIEQIHGAGLSGITGKTASGSKNSVFAALMAILEKHAQGSGKGLQKLVAQQGKVLVKSKLLFAAGSKGDALTTKKHTQPSILITKDKHGKKDEHGKKKTDDAATPLIAANIVINQTIQTKKTEKTLETKSIFSTSQAHGRNKQAGLNGQPHTGVKQPLQSEALRASAKAIVKDQPSVNSLQTAVKDQPSVNSLQTAVKYQTSVNSQYSDTAMSISGKASINGKQAIPSAQKNHAADSNKTGLPIDHVFTDANRQSITTNTTSQSTTPAVTGQAVDASVEAANISADVSGLQSKKVTSGGETLVQLQQGKNAQTLQSQNNATLSTAANMVAGLSDTSLKDSGSHSSGSGNQQDGGNSQILNGDAKTGVGSLASNTQFKHYLSSKTTPVMSLFDSMTHIAQSARKGKTRLDIQLEPANLGKIQISLQSDAAKHLHVHIIVDQSATRQLIDQQLPQLKNALAQQGFDLSGFSMGSQDQHASSGGDKGQRKHAVIHTTETAVETVNVITSPNRMAGGTGLSIRI